MRSRTRVRSEHARVRAQNMPVCALRACTRVRSEHARECAQSMHVCALTSLDVGEAQRVVAADRRHDDSEGGARRDAESDEKVVMVGAEGVVTAAVTHDA